MGDIIALRGDPHRNIELLLPWYATEQLEEEDIALVESHLAGCNRCKAALDRERRLCAEIRGLPLNPDLGWEKLQGRLAPDSISAPRRAGARTSRWRILVRPGTIAGFAGLQAAMLVLVVAVLLLRPAPLPAPQVEYHTLSTPPARIDGNLIVIFRPDTTEESMRATLDGVGARLVDGPTAAGAYVLEVPSARRDSVLEALHSRRAILLAQPIGADVRP